MKLIHEGWITRNTEGMRGKLCIQAMKITVELILKK